MFLNNCFTRFLSVAILASELASFSLASVIENLDKRAGTKVQAAYFTNWYVSSGLLLLQLMSCLFKGASMAPTFVSCELCCNVPSIRLTFTRTH